MSTSIVVAGMPHYLLLDGTCRIGPQVLPSNSGTKCEAFYGFSDKTQYDGFCRNSEVEFRPYPLVKGFFRTQAEDSGDHLKLMVLDAAGPHETNLAAATMEAVLNAHQTRSPHVTATHQLVFDRELSGYRVAEVPL
jgi:hypothetical protein